MTNTMYQFAAPATGKCVPIEAVYNKTFSSKVLGDGVAIFPTEGEVVAPCDCIISCVSEASRAVTVLGTTHNLELMLCADIDDGMSNPKFSFCVEPGQMVKSGEVLFTCDVEDIQAQGYSVDFPCIITNASLSEGIDVTNGDVVRGESTVMSCEYVG